MNVRKIVELLTTVAHKYPSDLIHAQVRDIPRVAFQISLVVEHANTQVEHLLICDIGGGIGLFSVGCAALGFKKVMLVDDFQDEINSRVSHSIVESLHRKYGVQIIVRDVIADGLGGIPHRFDMMTCFDSMEHWHHSPKKLFHEVVTKLRPGAGFILGTPNCVNMRKRMTVPFGCGKWSTIQDWYETDTFRGHVREPDIHDLKYIAQDMGLTNVTVLGRNWLGHFSPNPLIRFATKCADYPLRLRPSLCSDLYLIGLKPAHSVGEAREK